MVRQKTIWNRRQLVEDREVSWSGNCCWKDTFKTFKQKLYGGNKDCFSNRHPVKIKIIYTNVNLLILDIL